jgi:uncharacterized membrane protein AbrB (regulator of aidB expression)
MTKLLAATCLTLLAGLASAHAGHGFSGPHWHASEMFGPAVMLGCAAGAFWLWSKKQ